MQKLEYLGCMLDTTNGSTGIPRHKISKAYTIISELITAVNKKIRILVRKVASVVGVSIGCLLTSS